MGKLRIVKENETYRVEELHEEFDPFYKDGVFYESWETLETFNSEVVAETFAEDYIEKLKEKEPQIIKEYDF